jgi:hypothetical protein
MFSYSNIYIIMKRMNSEIIELASATFVGVCVSILYWSFLRIFIEKKWLKAIISILLMGITIYLFT